MAHRVHYKELIKDSIQYLTFSSGFEAVQILLIPLLTRIFTKSEYGLVDSFALIVALSSTIVSLGIPSALARVYYEYDGVLRKVLISSTMAVVLLTGFCVLCFSTLCAPLLSHHFPKVDSFSLLVNLSVSAGILNAILSVLSAVLRIQRRILWCQLMNLTTLITQIILSCVFVVKFQWGVFGVVMASVIAPTIGALIGLYLIRHSLHPAFSVQCLRGVLSYSLPCIPASLASWVNSRGARYILVFYLGLYSAGVYAAGYRVASLFVLFVGAFQQAWGYYSVSLIGKDEFETLSKNILQYYLGVCFFLSMLFLMISPEVCELVLGYSHKDVLGFFPWLLCGFSFRGASNIVNAGAVMQKRAHVFFSSSLLSAIVNIVFSLSLLPFIGAVGASVAYCLAEMAGTVFFIRDTHTKTTLKFDLKSTATIVLCFLLLSNLLVYAQLLVSQYGFLFRLIIGFLGLFWLWRFTIMRKAFSQFWLAIQSRWRQQLP